MKTQTKQTAAVERKTEDCTEPKEGKDIRNLVTKIVVWSTIGVTVMIAVAVIVIPLFKDAAPDLDFIKGTLIPLWATWMGTVIAFYFGKSNFDSVRQSYNDIIKQLTPEEKIASISVCEVMIPFDKIETMDYEDSLSSTIKTILDEPRFKPYKRYAFIDDNNVLQYIIHRRNFAQYVTDKMDASMNIDVDKSQQPLPNPLNTTFKNFLDECGKNPQKQWLGVPVFISCDDNLLNAKTLLTTVPNNKDVFVTAHGKKDEPVLGLITDEDILKALKR